MPLNRSGVLAFAALGIAGCSLLRPFTLPAQTGTADLFVDEATFDGRDLTARVLIRVRGGDLSVQQDLAALNGLTVEDVTDCESGASVPFIEFSILVDPDAPRPLVRVQDGHWFGVNTQFPVYAEEFVKGRQPAPDCIDATIFWWIPHEDWQPSRPVKATVRVVTKRPGGLDAGAGAPPESNDAGSPPGQRDGG